MFFQDVCDYDGCGGGARWYRDFPAECGEIVTLGGRGIGVYGVVDGERPVCGR